MSAASVLSHLLHFSYMVSCTACMKDVLTYTLATCIFQELIVHVVQPDNLFGLQQAKAQLQMTYRLLCSLGMQKCSSGVT